MGKKQDITYSDIKRPTGQTKLKVCMYRRLLFAGLVLLLACGNDDDNGIKNESSQFALCNSLLTECVNGNGNYCLFGFKWGETNPIPNAGYDAEGPQGAGAVVSYSFQERNGTINTHAQVNLPSLSFDLLPCCAKDEIRNALAAWSAVAQLDFEEMPDNSDSDLKFYVAEIRQSGIGYPNYVDPSCIDMAGQIVIQANLELGGCRVMRNFFMHEIGHSLGLGHVRMTNIMSPEFVVLESLPGLQDGDVEGVIQLYGSR